MKRKKIIIGSRGSKLALIYAERAKKEIKKFYKQEVQIKQIITTGDKNQKDRLSDLGGKGLFSKNIEVELLENKVDVAVHALKDMPSIETEGLLTNCFLKRNYPNEILISKNNKLFKELKPKSIIGTSSFRREYQFKNKRKDLNFKLIRGNVDTRIRKLNEGLYDAIILSKAGVLSLNLENKITEEFSTDDIIPSVGQGVVAIQCRSKDEEMINFLKKINNTETYNCAIAEREVLKILEGDCETAVGAIAKIEENKINISAELFSIDGKKRYFFKSSKEIKFSKKLGEEVGKILKEKSNQSYKK